MISVFGWFLVFFLTTNGYKWQQIGYFVNNLNKWHLLALISNNWQQLFIVLQQMPTIGILWQHMFGKFLARNEFFWQQLFHFCKCQFCAKCLRMKCPSSCGACYSHSDWFWLILIYADLGGHFQSKNLYCRFWTFK